MVDSEWFFRNEFKVSYIEWEKMLEDGKNLSFGQTNVPAPVPAPAPEPEPRADTPPSQPPSSPPAPPPAAPSLQAYLPEMRATAPPPTPELERKRRLSIVPEVPSHQHDDDCGDEARDGVAPPSQPATPAPEPAAAQ